jgi:hypothetical protein
MHNPRPTLPHPPGAALILCFGFHASGKRRLHSEACPFQRQLKREPEKKSTIIFAFAQLFCGGLYPLLKWRIRAEPFQIVAANEFVRFAAWGPGSQQTWKFCARRLADIDEPWPFSFSSSASTPPPAFGDARSSRAIPGSGFRRTEEESPRRKARSRRRRT